MSKKGGDIIYCYCNTMAETRKTKKGQNIGKEYWTCPKPFSDKTRCTFFQWVENNNNNSFSSPNRSFQSASSFASPSSSSSSPPLNNKSFNSPNMNNKSFNNLTYSDDGIPLCPTHQVKCVQRKVTKENENKGKLFWTCNIGKNCFFKWCDESDKILINNDNNSDNNHYNNDPKYSKVRESKVSPSFGQDFLINFQFIGSNLIQTLTEENKAENKAESKALDKVENKAEKKEHETFTFTKDTFDCILITFPRMCTATTILVKMMNDLFGKDQKIFKKDELEYIVPISEYQVLLKIFLESKIDGYCIKVIDFPEITKLIVHHYSVIDLNLTEQFIKELKLDENLPKKVFNNLRPFQKQGVAFGIKRNGTVLIGDEMGLGKTLQAMSIQYYFKQDWPLLIICPSSLKFNWGREFEEWFISSEFGHCGITSDKIKIITNGKQKPDNYINIMSYNLAANMLTDNPQNLDEDCAIINECKFNCVICDESHYLKSTGTKRSAALTPFLQKVKRLILITGTPALSRPVEIFPQLNLLLDPLYRFTYSSFIYRYCDAKETQYSIDQRGSSNTLELNYLLSRTVMIRRRKDAVLTELPSKIRQQVLLNVKPKDLKAIKFSSDTMKRAVEKMKASLSKEEFNQKTYEKNAEYFKMFQMTGKAKLPAVKEYISDLIENDNLKFLVFAYHKDVMDSIEECVGKQLASLHKIKINKKDKRPYKPLEGKYFIRIDGDTDSKKRQTLVETFGKEESCRVAILSIKAAGVGYTMTACSTVLFAELYWTPSDLLQAEDRCHRIGQRNAVNVKYLLGKGTFDEYLWPLLQKKLEVVGTTLDRKSHKDENMDRVHFDRMAVDDDDEEIIDNEDDMDETEEDRRFINDNDEEDSENEEEEKVDLNLSEQDVNHFMGTLKGRKINNEEEDNNDNEEEDDLIVEEEELNNNHNIKGKSNNASSLKNNNNNNKGSSSFKLPTLKSGETRNAIDVLRNFVYVPKTGILPPNVRETFFGSGGNVNHHFNNHTNNNSDSSTGGGDGYVFKRSYRDETEKQLNRGNRSKSISNTNEKKRKQLFIDEEDEDQEEEIEENENLKEEKEEIKKEEDQQEEEEENTLNSLTKNLEIPKTPQRGNKSTQKISPYFSPTTSSSNKNNTSSPPSTASSSLLKSPNIPKLIGNNNSILNSNSLNNNVNKSVKQGQTMITTTTDLSSLFNEIEKVQNNNKATNNNDSKLNDKEETEEIIQEEEVEEKETLEEQRNSDMPPPTTATNLLNTPHKFVRPNRVSPIINSSTTTMTTKTTTPISKFASPIGGGKNNNNTFIRPSTPFLGSNNSNNNQKANIFQNFTYKKTDISTSPFSDRRKRSISTGGMVNGFASSSQQQQTQQKKVKMSQSDEDLLLPDSL
ncbi:hypothetical protein ABK040_000013 [Willaertia magna]